MSAFGVSALKKADKPQTFTKIFRWSLPAGQTQKPGLVEVAGTFTRWQKVPLRHDATQNVWQATLRDIPCNHTHHYMLLVDGRPARDTHADGMAIPRTPQETQFALTTERGPRVFMLFAQTK
jgi:hypothetical protein